MKRGMKTIMSNVKTAEEIGDVYVLTEADITNMLDLLMVLPYKDAKPVIDIVESAQLLVIGDNATIKEEVVE